MQTHSTHFKKFLEAASLIEILFICNITQFLKEGNLV